VLGTMNNFPNLSNHQFLDFEVQWIVPESGHFGDDFQEFEEVLPVLKIVARPERDPLGMANFRLGVVVLPVATKVLDKFVLSLFFGAQE